MRQLVFLGFLLSSLLACASGYRARFELDSKNFKEGIRFVEFKTASVDVAYKVIDADENNVTFNVYFTNISKRTMTVDRATFYIVSLSSKETVNSEDPDDISGVDKSDFLTKSVLKPRESASGQVRFSLKEAGGRWVLKNKLTSNSFYFAVKEE